MRRVIITLHYSIFDTNKSKMKKLHDLNSLKIFRDVVSAGGYSAAHKITGQSRATLSRNISQLEAEVGARLIERSTRSFRLTEQGQVLYDSCLEVFSQLDHTFSMLESQQVEPSGLVKIAVPPSLLHFYNFSNEILKYMTLYEKVNIHIEATNRQVDILNEGFDFVIRARNKIDYPLGYVPVFLAHMELCLVAHPKWRNKVKPSLMDTLENIPAITWKGVEGVTHWQFMNNENQSVDIKVKPCLIVDDMTMMRNAALDGLGLVLIPYIYVENDIALGRLIRIESELIPSKSSIHAVHLGQKGMRPAVRHLLDWLKELTISLR